MDGQDAHPTRLGQDLPTPQDWGKMPTPQVVVIYLLEVPRACFQTRRSPLTHASRSWGKPPDALYETLRERKLANAALSPLASPLGRRPRWLPLRRGEKETLKAPLYKGGWGDLQRLRCLKKGLKTRPNPPDKTKQLRNRHLVKIKYALPRTLVLT
jgi:hypothetical protein